MTPSAVAAIHSRASRSSVLSGCWLAVICTSALTAATTPPVTNNFVAGDFPVLNDNGAWSWFMDERAIVDQGRLLVGSVRASGRFEQPGWGNVELAILDLASGAKRTVVVHEHFEQDDHNAPALLRLGGGRYLAAYSRHGQEAKLYLRRSLRPGDPYEWAPEQEIATPGIGGNFDNSLYHGFIRGGLAHASDGRGLGPLPVGTNTSFHAWDFTRLHQGGPTNVAWMCDVQLDADERPIVLFTTQRDGAGRPMSEGGMDHRFHYARWDGTHWVSREIAYAGTRLYPGEDDYTGLGAIDPQSPNVVNLSTDADPVTGQPPISKASYRRFHELFRGETADGGAAWKWTAITSNSSTDNLRPLVPNWPEAKRRTLVVWMRGGYGVNRGEWNTAVAATLLPTP